MVTFLTESTTMSLAGGVVIMVAIEQVYHHSRNVSLLWQGTPSVIVIAIAVFSAC